MLSVIARQAENHVLFYRTLKPRKSHTRESIDINHFLQKLSRAWLVSRMTWPRLVFPQPDYFNQGISPHTPDPRLWTTEQLQLAGDAPGGEFLPASL